jgi:hypothetical protein
MFTYLTRIVLALTNMVNLYLGSDKDTELRALVKDSKAQLDGYVYEALSSWTAPSIHARILII